MSEPIEGRLHPVTPLRKSWGMLFGVATLMYQLSGLLEPEGTKADDVVIPVPVAAAIGVAFGLAVVALFVVGWRASHYRLADNVLEYRYGVVFKTHRRFEMRHVQTVDIARPFLGRPLGVCTLRVDLAGETMRLSYLTLNQAKALKARILAEPDADVTVHRVNTRDLVLSLLLDVRTNLFTAAMATIGILPYALSGNLFALSTLAATAPKVWKLTGRRLFQWHGWTVLQTADDAYRIDYGLFDAAQYTYRQGRVASITLEQPILWRRFGWVRVNVHVAGATGSGYLLPVAPRHIAEKMVSHLLGPEALDALTDPTPAPHSARWCTPFHKAHGYRLTGPFFTSWRGLFLHNLITICPTARIQAVEVIDGPWIRRFGLADVVARTADGNTVNAEYRDRCTAAVLRDLLRSASLREARTATTTARIPGHRTRQPEEKATT